MWAAVEIVDFSAAQNLRTALSFFANLIPIPWMKIQQQTKYSETYAGHTRDRAVIKKKLFTEIPDTARPLAQHTSDLCIWPVGGNLFCCAPHADGTYCAYHAEASANTQAQKKADPEGSAQSSHRKEFVTAAYPHYRGSRLGRF